jgi:hypothetical protein
MLFVGENNLPNGKIHRSTDYGVTFEPVYTITNSRKPTHLYKQKNGKILLLTEGTSNNILESSE